MDYVKLRSAELNIRSRHVAVDAPAGRDEIFVVDDDPSIRQTLRIVFSKAGHDVICFADGDALLAAARAKCPYCIVLDVNIP